MSSLHFQRSLNPELALTIRTLDESGQIPRERIPFVLDIPEHYVSMVLDGPGLFPRAQPDWDRACDPLLRTLARWAPSPPRRPQDASQEPPKGNHWSTRIDHMTALAEGE